MTPLYEWAKRHNISNAALSDLKETVMGFHEPSLRSLDSMGETSLQQRIRVKASTQGRRMWRNNRGVAFREDGVPIRFGLANDSAKLDKQLKSSDLIGITPVIVRPEHVGHTFGLFTSWEIKHPGWSFDPNDDRAVCQHRWNNLVVSLGGDGRFINSENQI